MDDDFGPLVPLERVRMMQIIAGAMVTGIAVFAGVALFLAARADQPAAVNMPVLSLMGITFILLAMPGSFLIPAVADQVAVKQIASGTFIPPPGSGRTIIGQLLTIRQRSLIIGQAMLEGAATFGLVAFIVEHTSGLDGFFGASSIERLATEVAITEQTRCFKTIRPARKPVALGGCDGLG